MPADFPFTAIRVTSVLVADDNMVNQLFATRILEKEGYHVTVATNGQEALAALTVHHIDVVPMDIDMPVMDGFEATAIIRAREHGTGRRLPIIAWTAHAMDADRRRCQAAGMDAYISKPVCSRDLLNAVGCFI